MQIAIYQINLNRDTNHVAFMNMRYLEEHKGYTTIDASIYDKVFEGNVTACKSLEDVFSMFNVNIPANYTGRSMSVSDVVAIHHYNGTVNYFFCDMIGFKEISFDPSQTGAPKEKMIKGILCEPNKKARIVEIKNALKSLQAAVDGYIEVSHPCKDEMVCLICNEEGKVNGLSPNRALFDENGEITDIICGTFFICGCDTENFTSLNESQLAKYHSEFYLPQRFFRINGKIVAIPYC